MFLLHRWLKVHLTMQLNIMIERLWRSVKYENVYLKDYQDGRNAFYGLKEYFAFYNNERIHQSLGYLPPCKVHYGN